MNHAQNDLYRSQIAFASAIRDPDNSKLPDGINPERMAVYQTLFINNIVESLRSAFPVIHELLEEDRWTSLVRRFFAEHRAQTPEYPRLPQEFLAWLQTAQEDLPPFMVPLALWEWTELEVMLEPWGDLSMVDRHGDWLEEIPFINPTLRLHRFDYPVQQISAQFQPDAPLDQPIHLAAYRNEEEQVDFIELNRFSAALLQSMQRQKRWNGKTLLKRLATDMSYPDVTSLLQFAETFVEQLRHKQVLLGVRIVREELRG